MTVIEKVARAMRDDMIRHAIAENGGQPLSPGPRPWEEAVSERSIFLEAARAALEALREPSEGMLSEGWAIADAREANLTVREIGYIWSAMLNAALNEPAS